MDDRAVVAALAALAQPHRLKLFRALVIAGQAGLTPSTMAAGLGIPSATLSFHLKELLHAGLITQQRDGRNLIYRAAYARMNDLITYLTANCCQGEACAVPAAATAACAC